MLGIIGGMGPHAGKNLFKCILDQTKAEKDQDHLPVILWSTPNLIEDRSRFLMGETNVNPAFATAEMAKKMHQLGVKIIGVPCNTFHAKPIWRVFQQNLKENTGNTLKLMNMIKATANNIALSYSKKNVGILGTTGTYKFNIYGDALKEKQISFVVPDSAGQSKVHQSIYDTNFGIKCNGKITGESLEIIISTVKQLTDKGADLILLGCTELSLIPNEIFPKDVLFIDPVKVLAKAMIEVYLNQDNNNENNTNKKKQT